MADENTYGFRKSDAGELINLIGSGATEFSEEWPGGGGGGGGGGDNRVVVFMLQAGFIDNEAPASFFEIDGVSYIGSGTLLDPTGIVGDELGTNHKGLAFYQNGQYVFLNAHCNQEDEEDD